MERYIWNDDVMCIILSYLEEDVALNSLLCSSKTLNAGLSRNPYLWMMISSRISCDVCFLESKSCIDEYIGTSNDSDKFWKMICKINVAARRIRRQWRVNLASRVMIKGGGIKKNLKESQDNIHLVEKFNGSGQLDGSDDLGTSSINYVPSEIQSVAPTRKGIFESFWNSFSSSRKSKSPNSNNKSRSVWRINDGNNLFRALLNRQGVYPSENRWVSESIASLLDVFINLEYQALLCVDPKIRHSHNLSTLPKKWRKKVKHCKECINSSPVLTTTPVSGGGIVGSGVGFESASSTPATAPAAVIRTTMWREALVVPSQSAENFPFFYTVNNNSMQQHHTISNMSSANPTPNPTPNTSSFIRRPSSTNTPPALLLFQDSDIANTMTTGNSDDRCLGRVLEMRDCLEDLYFSVGGGSILVKDVRWFVTHIRSNVEQSFSVPLTREVLIAVGFSNSGTAAKISAVTSTRKDFRWV